MEETTARIMPPNETAPGKIVAFLICLVAVILRRPDAVWMPQFWAEDGVVFWVAAFRDGFRASFFQNYAGYLHVIPRLAAGVAAFFPSRYSPAFYNGFAILLASISIWLFYLPPARSLIKSDWLRLLLCVLFISAHPGIETVNNLTNLHWYMSVGVLVLLYTPIRGWRWSLPAAFFILLATTSSAAPILYVPIALTFLAARKADHYAASLAVVIGACIQIAAHALSPSTTSSINADSRGRVLAISFDHLCTSFLAVFPGFETARWLNKHLYGLNVAIACVFFGAVVLTLHRRHLLMLVGSSYLLIALSIIPVLTREGVDMSSWTFFAPGYVFDSRYLLLPFAIVLFLAGKALEELYESGRISLRTFHAALLAGFLVVACSRPDTRPFRDLSWSEYADLLDAGKTTEAPIQPIRTDRHWWIDLRRK